MKAAAEAASAASHLTPAQKERAINEAASQVQLCWQQGAQHCCAQYRLFKYRGIKLWVMFCRQLHSIRQQGSTLCKMLPRQKFHLEQQAFMLLQIGMQPQMGMNRRVISS